MADQPSSGAAAADSFAGFIGPRNLLGLVRNTAPYLFDEAPPETEGDRLHEHARHPLGWWSILRRGESVPATEAPSSAERTDYFALCLAAHFGTVTTFVPTDVDTKIRDALWYLAPHDPAELRRMVELSLGLARWDIRTISARVVEFEDEGPVSGHDGERLSVLCGGLLGTLAAGDHDSAARLEAAIDDELHREARAFDAALAAARRAQGGRDLRPGVRLCVMSAHLTHNVGDVDQGLSARGGQHVAAAARARFGRLAHEGHERYGGAFARAAAIYREVMAPEQHRHYPLRELRPLRRHRSMLLPLAPFLDGWGETIASTRLLRASERAEVVAGLVGGCRKVANQEGYSRALAGFDRAFGGGLASDDLQRALPAAQRRELRDADLRRRLAVSRERFEATLVKRALVAVQSAGG